MLSRVAAPVVLILGLSLQGCAGGGGSGGAQQAAETVRSEVKNINEAAKSTNSGPSPTATAAAADGAKTIELGSAADYDREFVRGKDIEIAGKVLVPGELPEDLGGTVFYPIQRSAMLDFRDHASVRILLPQGGYIPADYTVDDEEGKGFIDLTYKVNEVPTTVRYNITKCDDVVVLHLNTLEAQDRPFALMLRAKAANLPKGD